MKKGLVVGLFDSSVVRKGEKYKSLFDNKMFIFPETASGHDNYILGRIKVLALNSIIQDPRIKTGFDILGFINMLFWIEKYNLDLLKKYERSFSLFRETVGRLNEFASEVAIVDYQRSA